MLEFIIVKWKWVSSTPSSGLDNLLARSCNDQKIIMIKLLRRIFKIQGPPNLTGNILFYCLRQSRLHGRDDLSY